MTQLLGSFFVQLCLPKLQSFVWRWRMWKLQMFSHLNFQNIFERFPPPALMFVYSIFRGWRHRRILLNIITHKGISLFSIKGGNVCRCSGGSERKGKLWIIETDCPRSLAFCRGDKLFNDNGNWDLREILHLPFSVSISLTPLKQWTE